MKINIVALHSTVGSAEKEVHYKNCDKWDLTIVIGRVSSADVILLSFALFIQGMLGNTAFCTGTLCAAVSNEEDGNDKMTQR